METATLRLFKAIQVGNEEIENTKPLHEKSLRERFLGLLFMNARDNQVEDSEVENIEVKEETNRLEDGFPQPVLERMIRNGYILDPAIRPTRKVLNAIEEVVGISGEKANAAFHKSWTVVQDSSMESLVMQQIVHYMTTYGFEQLGIYRQESVYIPHEVLELPAIREDIPLVVIRAMDAQELLDAIVNLGSGIALAQQTLDDIMTIVKANDYDNTFVEKIGNRELKSLLNDYYGVAPSEPVAFLRYLITKLTGESLLIKNDDLIEKIKQADGKDLDALLPNAPDDLASIFFRFKPLFLAMKTISGNKAYFNRLRKQANKLHNPLPEDYLNSITAHIKHGQLDSDRLQQRLERASIFRKIRLAYALNYRLHCDESTVYRVRNGRGWATDFAWPVELKTSTQRALDMVLASIVGEIREHVTGRTVYIPANVYYALPATEKQFTGHFPTGSYVIVPEDLIVGIHWTNTASKRVDLDLSVIGESGKIGWDAAYRSEENAILFSGDVTDAPPPNGASELFYFKRGQPEARILMVNFYNSDSGDEVEARILVAHEKPENFDNNYMVDVNNIIVSATINITKRQNVLGLIANIDGENRVYLANVSIGTSITSSRNTHSTHARKYLTSSAVNSLGLRQILQAAGANVLTERPDGDYLDMSPQALDKNTIVDIINPPPNQHLPGVPNFASIEDSV